MRVGSRFPAPNSVRALSTWLSPADRARLFHAALTAERVGHTVVHGSSADTRLRRGLGSARALGRTPRDDSEPYAARLLAEQGEPDLTDPAQNRLGGPFVTGPPIWPYRAPAAPGGRAGSERARPRPDPGTRSARFHNHSHARAGPRRSHASANGPNRAASGRQQAWSGRRTGGTTSPMGPNGQLSGRRVTR